MVTDATNLDPDAHHASNEHTAPPEAADTLELEAFLPYQLAVLADTMSQSLSRLYSDRYGIGVPEWRVLANLGQRGTMTATEIGAHAQMHKTKVSRAVSGLVTRGYVKRERNGADQREALLQLTHDGQRIYGELVPSARAFNKALESMLTDSEKALLRSMLDRLTSRSRDLARAVAEDRLE